MKTTDQNENKKKPFQKKNNTPGICKNSRIKIELIRCNKCK